MAFHDYYINDTEKTIRGAFVNLIITLLMAILVGMGACFESVAKNISTMSTFMLGFWGLSFGFWKGSGLIESYTDKKFSVPKPWDGKTERRNGDTKE
jgi:uncharacterized protein YacL